MDLGLKYKSALVLSSTKGMGFGCAKALAAEGVRVVINGRNKKNGEDALSKIEGEVYFAEADITKPSGRNKLFGEVRKKVGSISILVTNADGPPAGSFIDKNSMDWLSAFNLVMSSALEMAQKSLPDMIEKGFGRIINISSTSAKETVPGLVLANSLKPALLGAFGTLAREVSDKGITVNSILPGAFNTERMRNYAIKTFGGEISSEEAVKRYEENLPMKRMGSVDEIGALCAFLASKQASYITGQSILIDGGIVTSLL